MVWWCVHRAAERLRLLPSSSASKQPRGTLVNVKLKWVKDRTLDFVVAREKHLRLALHLLYQISSSTTNTTRRPHFVPAHDLSALHLNASDISAFLRRFPALFREFPVSCFSLTDEALQIRRDEIRALRDAEMDLVDRLRRLLMLTVLRSLPIHTIDQLRWDMGLPPGYHRTLLPRHSDSFELVQSPGDERVWLRLVSWDPRLAVSELQRSTAAAAGCDNDGGACLAFPVRFPRGFGLKRKCMEWLREWQTLLYTSPYADASDLDPRTDVSEKRIVGVFHELLYLTLAKKTERSNVSNLRKPLGLPQKFTKVFGRHPGIFYLSEKLATQTVVLREAYGGGRELLIKHPLVEIRERYMSLMRERMAVCEMEEDASEDSDSDICNSSGLCSDLIDSRE